MTNEDRNKLIGNRIKEARDMRGMTLEDIANDVHLAKSTIQRYENAKIISIKIPVIEAIAKSLHVDPVWLMGEDVPMIPKSDAEQFGDSEISLSKDKIDEFISFIEPSWKKNFDSNYNITRTEDAAFIYFWFDGMRDVFIKAKMGDSESIESYEKNKTNWLKISSSTYDILKQYDQNAHLVLILANDKQTDKALLMYLDGELYFDSIDEKEE